MLHTILQGFIVYLSVGNGATLKAANLILDLLLFCFYQKGLGFLKVDQSIPTAKPLASTFHAFPGGIGSERLRLPDAMNPQ